MPRFSKASSPGRKPGGSPHTEFAGELMMIDGDPQIYLISNKTHGPGKNSGQMERKNVRNQRP